MMTLRSLSIGRLESLDTPRGTVDSGIRKRPVMQRLAVGRLGVDGDRQADRAVHGGPNKAVYLFPSEHYSRWAQFLGRGDLVDGFFGENLTTEGISERSLCIGDQIEIGSVLMTVRSPRLPCYKFVALTGNPRAARLMLDQAMTGVYLSVERGGQLGPGDAIRILHHHPARIPLADYVDAMMQRLSPDRVARVLLNNALPDDRKQLLVRRLESRYDGTV